MVVSILIGIALGYWLGRYLHRSNSKVELQERNNVRVPVGGRSWVPDSCHFKPIMDLRVIEIFLVSLPQYFLWDRPVENYGKFERLSGTKNASGCTTENGSIPGEVVRAQLRSKEGSKRESGVDIDQVPKHVAVIMDGNRRYGKARYGSASRGHWDGSSKLIEFAKWCIAEQIAVLTVYAFSTENWNRGQSEVDSLMEIFLTHCDELRQEALKRDIRIFVLSSDRSRIPPHVKSGLERLVEETKCCAGGLTMNICLSYGSRGEILNAARSLALDAVQGKLDAMEIDEKDFQDRLLTNHCCDPDVLIRTSGEIRVSNFLLWQMAYSEMFFISKPWPAIEKEDLLRVIQAFAMGRRRRYGK